MTSTHIVFWNVTTKTIIYNYYPAILKKERLTSEVLALHHIGGIGIQAFIMIYIVDRPSRKRRNVFRTDASGGRGSALDRDVVSRHASAERGALRAETSALVLHERHKTPRDVETNRSSQYRQTS